MQRRMTRKMTQQGLGQVSPNESGVVPRHSSAPPGLTTATAPGLGGIGALGALGTAETIQLPRVDTPRGLSCPTPTTEAAPSSSPPNSVSPVNAGADDLGPEARDSFARRDTVHARIGDRQERPSKPRTTLAPGAKAPSVPPKAAVPKLRAPVQDTPRTTLVPGAKMTSSAPPAKAPAAPVSRSSVPPRRPRATRPPLRVDEVGVAATMHHGASAATGGPSSLSRTAVPRLVLTREQLEAAPIDHRAGFLVAQLQVADENTTVQALIDVSGMPESEAIDILLRLKRLGIVAFS